jgi:acyl carrier protein
MSDWLARAFLLDLSPFFRASLFIGLIPFLKGWGLSPGGKVRRAGILLEWKGLGSPRRARHQGLRSMSAREQLRSTLLSLLEEEMGQSFTLPRDDEDLRESLGLDSVDLVGLVMRIEREFRVRLSPEELAAVKRVGDLLDLMEAKLSQRADRPEAPEIGAR